MRKLLLTFLASLLSLTLLLPDKGEASDLTLISAINKAGRQRMLSQRIAKSYAAIGLDFNATGARQQLDAAVTEFEGNLAELKIFFIPTPAIKNTLADLEDLWPPFRDQALGPVTKAGAETLLAKEAKLLAAAEKLTRLYQNYAGYSLGRLVNLSGRQRMLSQRLTKLYLLSAWGVDYPPLREETRQAREEFENALWELEIAPQNNYEINRELEHAVTQWKWFTSALEQEGDYHSYLAVVFDAGESLLASMDFLTSLYEVQASR